MKKVSPKEKTELHPRNKHRNQYDFKALIKSCSELSPFVILNKYGNESIDFFNPEAVKTLNYALLKHFYNIEQWDIPEGYLCPPIPGRADYIHHIADLLNSKNTPVKCLDIGVGANCIYPIVGIQEYNWSFVGADIEKTSLQSAQKIIDANPFLKNKVELRFQKTPSNIFEGIIQKGDFFDLTICNPPFHSSFQQAKKGSIRKVQNLKGKKQNKVTLNFGGQNNELWCDGGEEKFIQTMILESKQFSSSCRWFSTLVSKETTLKNTYKTLEKVNALTIKTIPMGQGNKISRIVAWSFQSDID